MKPITLTFELSPQSPEETQAVLEDFLEALTRANQRYFRAYPEAACCPGCAGVRYTPPTPAEAATSTQSFVDAARMLADGKGACGEVAAMVCARMRELQGKPDATVRCVPVRVGGLAFHAVVDDGTGRIVDATQEMKTAEHTCSCEG